MKKYIFFIAILFSCNQPKVEKKKLVEKVIVEKQHRKFYDCNSIEHYYLDISEEKINQLMMIENKTNDEKILDNLLTGYYPKSISEKGFEANLNKFHFVKTVLSKSKKIEVENIFTEKDSSQTEFSSCIPYYRDIFIFKKNDSIVGISKVCFGCGVSYFFGAKVNTEGFGLRTELEKLEKIIRKN